jgi:DNA polymerase III subunit epsilon
VSSDLLPFLPRSFVVLDVETTGLDPARDLIIEVAAIKFTIGEVNHAGFNCLVKIPVRVPPFISTLTGITSEMLDASGYQIEEVLDAAVAFFEDKNLVAFNADFDMGFLNASLERSGRAAIRNPCSCALKMARKAWPTMRSHKLATLAHARGLNTEGAHRALKDCEMAIHIYLAAAHTLQSSR